MTPQELTIEHAQIHQPWIVPYSNGVNRALDAGLVPHILASHNVLHAIKTLGKLATVFEKLDHTGGVPSPEDLEVIRGMSADLMTEALRFANLYGFSLAEELVKRVADKNGGINILELPPQSKHLGVTNG